MVALAIPVALAKVRYPIWVYNDQKPDEKRVIIQRSVNIVCNVHRDTDNGMWENTETTLYQH